MTKKQFDAAVKKTGLQPKSIEAARMVLVDGEKIVKVAYSLQMKKQQVWAIVNRVKEVHNAS